MRSGVLAMVVMLMLAAMTVASQQPAAPSGRVSEIHIQIIDSRTHLPMKGRRVQITFSGADGQFYNKAPHKVGNTGPDGIVTFEVNEPIPPYIGVFLWYAYECSSTGGYATRSVIEDGVISSWRLTGYKKTDDWCTPDSQAPPQQAQPGKLVISAHPMNRFVWSWYDTFQ